MASTRKWSGVGRDVQMEYEPERDDELLDDDRDALEGSFWDESVDEPERTGDPIVVEVDHRVNRLDDKS